MPGEGSHGGDGDGDDDGDGDGDGDGGSRMPDEKLTGKNLVLQPGHRDFAA